jgi:hypothetical protein
VEEAVPDWHFVGQIYPASRLVLVGPKFEEEAIPSLKVLVKRQQVVAIEAVIVT